MDKITSLGVFVDKPPNHVLVNEYLAGQGIMVSKPTKLFLSTFKDIQYSLFQMLAISSRDKASTI